MGTLPPVYPLGTGRVPWAQPPGNGTRQHRSTHLEYRCIYNDASKASPFEMGSGETVGVMFCLAYENGGGGLIFENSNTNARARGRYVKVWVLLPPRI